MREVLGIFEVGPNGEVKLPPAKCRESGIKPGDAFDVRVEGDAIMLTRSRANSGKIKKPHK